MSVAESNCIEDFTDTVLESSARIVFQLVRTFDASVKRVKAPLRTTQREALTHACRKRVFLQARETISRTLDDVSLTNLVSTIVTKFYILKQRQ
jgi:hypothetical protein